MDKKLFDILVCPICKGPLIYKKASQENELQELICRFDQLAYPIRDGIPVMLESEARQISSEEREVLST